MCVCVCRGGGGHFSMDIKFDQETMECCMGTKCFMNFWGFLISPDYLVWTGPKIHRNRLKLDWLNFDS